MPDANDRIQISVPATGERRDAISNKPKRLFGKELQEPMRKTVAGRADDLYECFVKVLGCESMLDLLKVQGLLMKSVAGKSNYNLGSEARNDLEALMRRTRGDGWKKNYAKLSKGVDVQEADVHVLGGWSWECWLSEQLRLGPLPRLLLLVRILFSNHENDDAVKKKLEEHVNNEFGLAAFLRDGFNKRDPDRQTPEHYRLEHTAHRALTLLLNRSGFRDRLPDLTYKQIMDIDLGPVTGVESLHAFEDWLRTGTVAPRHSVEDLHWDSCVSYLVYKDAIRVRELVLKVEAFLSGNDDQRPLMELISRTHASVLKVVATKVAHTLAMDEHFKNWRVIWLTATRSTDPKFRNTLWAFLEPLAKAFAVPMGDISAPLSTNDLSRIVEALRRGLARASCLVVVEGLFSAGGRAAPLLNYLSGASQFEDLIRSLCVPPLEELLRRDARHAVCRSRFLVLGTHASRHLGWVAHESIELGVKGLVSKDWLTWIPQNADALNRINAHANLQAIKLNAALGCTIKTSEKWVCAVHTGFVSVPSSVANHIRTLNAFPSDAALAMMLVHKAVRLQHDEKAQSLPSADVARVEEDSVALSMRQLLEHLRDFHPEHLCVLALIACVPDGIFIDSMTRIYKHWSRLVLFNEIDQKKVLIKTKDLLAELAAIKDEPPAFLVTYRSILSEDQEQAAEHLGLRQIRWEVGDTNSSSKRSEITPEIRYGEFKTRLSFASPIIRQHFVAQFRGLALDKEMKSMFGVQGWWLLQFCAAGECKRQGSALLRNAEAGQLASLARYRRLIQSVHHVVAAGPMPGVKLPVAISGVNDFQLLSFPGEASRREIYAHALMYHKVIEQDSRFRLSRSWGRSELRLALLAQMLHPGQDIPFLPTRDPKTILEFEVPPPLDRSAQEVGAQGVVCSPGEALLWDQLKDIQADRFQTHDGLASKPMMYREFLNNLAHAASDVQDEPAANFARKQIQWVDEYSKLMGRGLGPDASQGRTSDVVDAAEGVDQYLIDGGSVRIGRYQVKLVAHQVPEHEEDWEAHKLDFDLMDANGDRLPLAEQKCLSPLVGAPMDLGNSFVDSVLAPANRLADIAAGKGRFDLVKADKELSDVLQHLLKKKRLARDRLAMADLLVRWSDVRSNMADALSGRRAQRKDLKLRPRPGQSMDEAFKDLQLRQFLEAWVIFWLADAVRDSVGVADDHHGTIWGSVSSRYYRTGIRTSLKLARMLATMYRELHNRGDSSEGHMKSTKWLLNFAQSRCDILVLDIHMNTRERFQATLLQSALARTWAVVDKALNPSNDKSTDEISRHLRDALDYVASAERKLLALGSPIMLARRWLVERLQVLMRRLDECISRSSIPNDITRKVSRYIRYDLNVLEGMSRGHPFWDKQHARQMRHYEELLKKCPGL